jgi:hypothetical protein
LNANCRSRLGLKINIFRRCSASASTKSKRSGCTTASGAGGADMARWLGGKRERAVEWMLRGGVRGAAIAGGGVEGAGM